MLCPGIFPGACIPKVFPLQRRQSGCVMLLGLLGDTSHIDIDLIKALDIVDSVKRITLTKLESRPIPGSDFEFIFYFDMEASVMSDRVLSLLSELMAEPESFVFLGNYAEVV